MDYKYYSELVDTNKNGIETLKGRVVIDGVSFDFHVNPSNTQGYRQRAHMSVISPKDGKVLQVVGKKRKKIMERLPETKKKKVAEGKRLRELMAACDFFIATDDPKQMEIMIVNKARELNGKYGEEIRAAQNRPLDKCISAARAFQACGTSFGKNLKTLENLCNMLSEKAMRDVTEDDIHEIANQLKGSDETRKRKLSLLRRFWDYCLIVGIIDGQNPVEQYLRNNPGLNKRRYKRVARIEKRPGRLSKEEEKVLLQYVRGQLDNGFSLAVPLMTGGGIPPAIQAKLKWSDVIIDQNDHSDVWVRIIMDNSTWATQDYSRALFREEGAIVYERYEKLCKMFSDRDALNELPVISAKADTTKMVPAKEITAYIRDALLRTVVKNSTLAPSMNQNRREGMGTQFLRQHYAAKLLECGLETDKGLLDFLRLRKISSVTANYYRSFTSAEAKQYIRAVLDRYRGCDQNVDSKPITKAAKRREGKRRIWMEQSDSPRCNKMEVSIVLGKGQELSLDSLKGIRGELYFQPVNKKLDEEEADKKGEYEKEK